MAVPPTRMSPYMTKDQLRHAARAKRARLAAGLPDFKQSIARFAGELPIVRGAAVATYWPLRDEADPRQLAAALAVLGHPILLPAITKQLQKMAFRLWREGDRLERGLFDVYEPLATAPVLEPRAILVPLLAFDARGHRLGYGGGYYDRALGDLRQAGHKVFAIGIAYSGQELDILLTDEPHDQMLDMVVTELGVRKFAPASFPPRDN